MRWTHRERGPISPGVFIPLAEENGLIVELGAFALREACAAARSWQSSARSMVPPYVSVNLSAHQFHDPRLIERIEAALLDNHLSPDQLIIEITESAALLNVTETMNVLEQLRRLGVGIALDDFGTGYSSLAYLLRLRPKILKIDQSFVRPNHESSLNTSLLETIVSLGKKLEMTMLAEGIETSQQYEQLRDLNCDLGQGFLWSPAIPCDEAAALVGLDFRN
jgi:EAL domain-containing protein (putative c-di-GMP-specific phosphodiesterase class I)